MVGLSAIKASVSLSRMKTSPLTSLLAYIKSIMTFFSLIYYFMFKSSSCVASATSSANRLVDSSSVKSSPLSRYSSSNSGILSASTIACKTYIDCSEVNSLPLKRTYLSCDEF